ncbi:hypothetical protein AVEN_131989-1 [Araneus ventricosus]|uniref:DUF4817 domain-containing protein n=1 Tax=Araneus ventricosus TaxID=182803 RepID=A0A4Y2B1N4_ARAVE|nr:hypothetical protein AVEN_131989-1 [Araneus ventricosus]
MPTLQEKAVLAKLFYLNQQNSVAAVKEFRRMKQTEDESKSRLSVEDVATAVVESSIQSPHGSVSVPVVSRVLDMPYSTVRKILRRILNFYPYKIKPMPIAGWRIRGQRYRDMLRDFVIPQLQQRGCLQDFILIQDGTSPHIDRRVKQFIIQLFTHARVIRSSFSNSMTSSFARLHTLRLLVVGSLKDNIYRKRPAYLPDLMDSIPRYVRDIPADSLRSAVGNMDLRLEHIVEHEGDHFEQFRCSFSYYLTFIKHIKWFSVYYSATYRQLSVLILFF